MLRLWADVDGSWIRVQEKKEPPQETFFEVAFLNKAGYPGNVTFRPCGDKPMVNRPEPTAKPAPPHTAARPLLRFSARLVESDKEQVYLGFRLIDRLGTHWCFAKGDTYQIAMLRMKSPVSESSRTFFDDGKAMATLQVKPAGLDSWVTLSIDLHADTWTLFGADGNCRYGGAQPDFSLISAVTIEFGGWSKQRSGPGLGVVQVKDFRLVDRATPAALPL